MQTNTPRFKADLVGFLFSLSLLIPSNYGLDIFGINFEDIPLIILLFYFSFEYVKNFKFLTFDKLFLSFIVFFIVYTNIFTTEIFEFNKTNLRFYFYFILAYLCIKSINFDSKNIIRIFEYLSIVVFVNFIIIIFKIQLPGVIDGWISNNTGSSNPFTSGRLGGIQGGGPNVIGIICTMYALLFLSKLFSSKNIYSFILKNKINLILFIISIFNLYLTYSRGSYMALFLGFILILYFSNNISKRQKSIMLLIILFISIVFISMFPSLFLKQSNRSFLRNLAISNIDFVYGVGGGNYIKEVYKDYLITLDDETLINQFNIKYQENEIDDHELVADSNLNDQAEGFIKMKFDYRDYIIPRSIVSFFYSNDNINWTQIGESHTSGYIIDLVENSSYFELGGWADGQSPGGSYLDGFVSSLKIKIEDDETEIFFTKENRDKNYFIFLPMTNSFYDNRNDGKIVFDENRLQLKRPRSYWIAIPNIENISGKDFEITIKLSLNNIPKGNETIFSQSSILPTTDKVNNQSWKWSIIDGRMYFFWVSDVVSGYSNFLGGQSLRSGKLISENGKFNSIISDFSLSQYDEITTAHNGFLTLAVEYSLLLAIIIVTLITYLIFKNFNKDNKLFLSITIALLAQNFSNDLIYSPDVAIYFWIIPMYFLYKVTTSYESNNPTD